MIDAFASDSEDEVPTSAMLERILVHAAAVEIIETSPVELDSAEAARIAVSGAEIAELARYLTIVDGGVGDTCRCPGWPTILVHDGDGQQIALLSLHHQTRIRGLGNCDADLQNASGLTDWLAEHGLTKSREVQLMRDRQRVEEEQRRTAWVAAAPPPLNGAAEAVSMQEGDAEARLADLVSEHYPEAIERIRALLSWAGFPPRHAAGTPWYEFAPQRILLTESTESIYEALVSTPPTPAQLDGFAELCTSFEWTASPRPEIPHQLRSQLIAHVQDTGTEAMRFRMRHGYGSGQSV